jgi:hypothetical protein
MKTIFACLSVLIACDSSSPELARGPERAVRDDRVCTYHYDAEDRLTGLDVALTGSDVVRQSTFTWEGDRLVNIESGCVRFVNEADGAQRIYDTDTCSTDFYSTASYGARFSLPLVLECDSVERPDLSDQVLSRAYFADGVEVEREDYEYTGVDAGEKGTRTRTTVVTPPLEDIPNNGFIYDIEFTYDDRGRRVREEVAEEGDPHNVTYDYRDDGRISYRFSGRDPAYEESFRYDDAGNLLAIERAYLYIGELEQLVDRFEY